jgi:hypothetical protein
MSEWGHTLTRSMKKDLILMKTLFSVFVPLIIFFVSFSQLIGQETLSPIIDGNPPQTLSEIWAGFDPLSEPLDTEILHEWEEDGVVLKVLRYRIGSF